jgi:hypothetical protein
MSNLKAWECNLVPTSLPLRDWLVDCLNGNIFMEKRPPIRRGYGSGIVAFSMERNPGGLSIVNKYSGAYIVSTLTIGKKMASCY